MIDVTITSDGITVDATIDSVGYVLPSQGGNAGKYLQTDGTIATWEDQAGGVGSGDLLAANNLSDVSDSPTALSNIGGEPLKGSDDNYVTDAEKVVLSNTSGINTGDQDISGISTNAIAIALNTAKVGVTKQVNQTGIGTLFVVGDIISQNATSYIKANATDDTKTAIGVVVEVTDNDNIIYQSSGSAAYTKSVLVKGTSYYLDNSDGNVTSTEPNNYVQPIFEATETNEININIGALLVFDLSANLFADLGDRDRVEQEETDLGNFTGSVNIDVSKSNNKIILTGNLTSVTFTNTPSSEKRTIVLLSVYQDGTGSRTINWVGSGVLPVLGDTSAELQPNTTASSITQYWLYWNGTNFTITMVQIGLAL